MTDSEADNHRDAAAWCVLDDELAVEGFDEAFRDREAESDTGRVVGVAQPLEGLEQAVALRHGNACSAIDDAQMHTPSDLVGLDAYDASRRRVSERVVDDVGDGAFQQRRIDVDTGKRLGNGDDNPIGAGAQARECRRDDLVESDRSFRRVERARLQPADVEEVVDELVEPIGLLVDRAHELVCLAARPAHVRLQPARGQRLDRGQRRAEVVADGPEERGSEVVGF